jgi:hypothetical protein
MVWLVSRKQRPSLEQIQKIFVVRTEKIVGTLRRESHTNLRQRELQILHYQNLGMRRGVTARRQEKAPSSVFALTPELVWREQPVRSSERDGRKEAVTSPEQVATRSLHQQDMQLQTATPSGRAPGMQTEKIDPRVLDQLTDNVIRQVERRIRIERERRGL